MVRKITFSLLGAVLLLCSCPPGYGQEFNNQRALANLSAVKVYFDVKTQKPDKLALQLGLIHETLQQFVKAGVKTELIIGFRDQASRFVTKDDDYVLEDDLEAKQKIQAWVRRFHAQGVFMEQCLISATFQEIEPEDFLPELAVIQSSYVSMIAYQAKGYTQITMQ